MKPISQPKVLGFLMEASQLYEERCPELSRYLMHEAQAAQKSDDGHASTPQAATPQAATPSQAAHRRKDPEQPAAACRHCGQLFRRADSRRVRLRPGRRPGRRVQSVLRRDARGKRLSLAQRGLLRRHRGSASVLMATCHTCNKTTRYSGANRDFLGSFTKSRGTPGSNGKRKSPQVAYRGSPGTPKMAGKEKTPGKTPSKTPSKTPRSSSSSTPGSSSSSSSKTPSGVKKWVVQRLSKMLHRDQKPSSKTGTLKDFLSSL